MKKELSLFIVLMFCSFFIAAQDKAMSNLIQLIPSSKTHDNTEIKGYKVALGMSMKFAQSYLKEQFKAYGKPLDGKDISYINNVTIGDLHDLTIYTHNKKILKNQCEIWLGIVQIDEAKDSLTKTMLHDWALELNKRNTEEMLADTQKDYEKHLSQAVSLNKKLASTKKSKANKEKTIISVTKQLEKTTRTFNTTKAVRDNYATQREQLAATSEAREKMDKKYNKAATKAISLQKKVTSLEKKKLNLQKGIRENDSTIKATTTKLEQNTIEKGKLEKDLEALKEKQKMLNQL